MAIRHDVQTVIDEFDDATRRMFAAAIKINRFRGRGAMSDEENAAAMASLLKLRRVIAELAEDHKREKSVS